MRDPTTPADSASYPDERYAKAFAVSPDAISVTDMETGRYLDVNASFEALMGYARESLVGRTSLELGIWADPNDRVRMVQALKTKGQLKGFHAVARRSDGTLRTCSLAGTVVESGGRACAVLVVHDISEHLATERALRQSAERYAKLFQSSPDAIALADLETGRLLEFNEGFHRTFGYDRESLSGKTTLELNLWADIADRRAMVRTLLEKGGIRDAEYTMRRRGGELFTVQMSGELIELNGATCALTVVRDVTAQRQAAQREAELEEQLRRVQKLEALGTLAGGIAHDFNNILTAILAYTEFTLMDPADADLVSQNLQEVRKGALRARDLVKQILAFSRHQKNERVAIDLRGPVRDALNLLRSTLPSTIEIEDHCADEPVVVCADAGQMHQVVMNLCTNAAHAMDGRPGLLRVRLELVSDEGVMRIALPGSRGGRRVLLAVSDNGCGMDDATLKRIFEPFFTTKDPGVGTGLGLSVVHGIVHGHDGSIEVKSAPGEGSEFRIYLPVKEGETPGREAGATEVPRGGGERILVIDDEASICDLAQRFLIRLGYQVSTYTNPVDALGTFVEAAPPFDLVLTDFTMPHMTGVEVARRVIERHPKLPVVMMSGYTGAWTPERLREAGVEHLISKPLTLAGLAGTLKTALAGARS